MDAFAWLFLGAAAVASVVRPRFWPLLFIVGFVCVYTHPSGTVWTV